MIDNSSTTSALQHNPELNGRISHALQQGKDFGYWLALLDEAINAQPHFVNRDSLAQQSHSDLTSTYRNPALAASDEDFVHLQHSARLLHEGQLTSLRLWQSIHPEPLALENDPARIDPEVIENCAWHVRQRLHNKTSQYQAADPTMLEQLIPAERAMLMPSAQTA